MPTRPPVFPVVGDPTLKGVPWPLIEPHERQAVINHGQSFDRLAQRGGLDITELAAVMEGKSYRAMYDGRFYQITDADITRATSLVHKALADYMANEALTAAIAQAAKARLAGPAPI